MYVQDHLLRRLLYLWMSLFTFPQLRRFMREMKANYTARPEEYDDYNLRTNLGVDAFSCG